MTHEAATNAAKASAYDGFKAYVMRKVYGPLWPGGPTPMTREEFAGPIKEEERRALEDMGWEVVETYEPKREVHPYGLMDGGKVYRRAIEAGSVPDFEGDADGRIY